MKSLPRYWSLITVAGLIVFNQPLAAIEVYKWKDSQNITHYSQIPPSTTEDSFEQLHIVGQTPEPDRTRENSTTSLIEYARYLESSRLERQKARLEKKLVASQLAIAQARLKAEIAAIERRPTPAPSFVFYQPYPHYKPYQHRISKLYGQRNTEFCAKYRYKSRSINVTLTSH